MPSFPKTVQGKMPRVLGNTRYPGRTIKKRKGSNHMSKMDILTTQFKDGKVTRRQFIEGATSLGLTTAAAVTMSATIAKASPKKGGNLRFGLGHGSTTDSTDPATYENGFTNTVFHAVHARLTEVTSDGGIGPEMAESWEASDDAAVWHFKLRKGVEFHNGKTVTPDDVVASIVHHTGEDSKSGAKGILGSIQDVKADGDTVSFTLDSGNADFPFLMSDYHLCILPSSDGKVDTSGVGCGSYKLDSFEPGVRATLSRNPNHFDGRGNFDSGEMLSILDSNARQNALVTGEVDVIDRIDTKTAHLLKRRPGISLKVTAGTQHFTFPMLTDMAPYDNNDLRLAIKWGIDRKQLLETVLNGYGAIGNDSPIAPSNRYYHADMAPKEYDLDKAKFHMKKSGLGNITVDLSAGDAAFAGAVDAAVLMKETLAPVGVNVNVVREPSDGYWSNVWLKKAWCACYWGGRPTEDMMFSTAYQAGVDWNDSNWNHAKFNELLLAARAELDSNKRRAMYYEMQEIVSTEGGVVIPMFSSYVEGISDKVGIPEVTAGNWGLDGGRALERWWFA